MSDSLCRYTAKVMQSSCALSRWIASNMSSTRLVVDELQLDKYVLVFICFIIGLCGISMVSRKIAISLLISLRLLVCSLDRIDNIHLTSISQYLHPLETSFPFLDFCLISCIFSIALRQLEFNYGPKRIPDPYRLLTSPNYLLSLTIRRIRQLTELILYTVAPGFYFHSFLYGDDIMVITQTLEGYCSNWNLMLQNFRQDSQIIEFLRNYILIIIFCGTFQRVFGSNPSYKGTIYDQYGESLPKMSEQELTDITTATQSDVEISVYDQKKMLSNHSSSSSLSRKRSTMLGTLTTDSTPRQTRSQTKTPKPKRSESSSE